MSLPLLLYQVSFFVIYIVKENEVTPMRKLKITANLEVLEAEDGPIPQDELKTILGKLRHGNVHHACDCTDDCEDCTCHSSSFDEETLASDTEVEEFSLDVEEDEPCAGCGSEPCVCEDDQEDDEHDAEGTSEEELSTANHVESEDDLLESVKNSLVGLKIRSKDWEVKEFMPILINIFPDLARHKDTPSVVINTLLNRLKTIEKGALARLNKLLLPTREA